MVMRDARRKVSIGRHSGLPTRAY
ncbi:protein of unknown function [Cupriavidus taiwanensis]|nr:protein of unknown function [Cupriavidus taiwanensis]